MTEFEIPEHLQHRPVLGGLVVPYITAQRPEDGMFVFGAIDGQRQRLCLIKRWCQICGRPIENPPYVFLLRPYEKFVLPNLETFELSPSRAPPSLRCRSGLRSLYARACPMLSGRKTHYRSSPVPIGEYAEHPADTDNRLGHAAEPCAPSKPRRTASRSRATTWLYAMVHQRGTALSLSTRPEPDKNP